MQITHLESEVVINTDPYADIPLSSAIEAGTRHAFALGDVKAALSGLDALLDIHDQFYPEPLIAEQSVHLQAVIVNGALSSLLHEKTSTSVSGTRTVFSKSSSEFVM